MKSIWKQIIEDHSHSKQIWSKKTNAEVLYIFVICFERCS